MMPKWRKICNIAMTGILLLGWALTYFLCLFGDLPDGLMEAWYILAVLGLIGFTLAHIVDACHELREVEKMEKELHDKRIRALIKLIEEPERTVTSNDRDEKGGAE